MQRKTLLSACIALALSGQGWAADITEIETTTGEKKNTNVTCPADPGKLSPEELKRLPSECSPVVEQNLMPWLATGAATALITALAIVELNDDDDHHHRNNSPLPPTPPDDNSDDTPVPPTPGGDEIIPDDGSDDTPTPPKPISFNNDVILDKTAKTLTIRDSVFTYTENADGTISLQDSNGRKATINIWQIDEANNTVALDGVSADGATKWQYNHNGELVITGDNATVNNNGKTIVDGKDSTGTEIAGNNGKVIQDGILDVSGGGHGIDITGDSATVDNKGGMTVTDPDSIGILIDGDKAIVNNDGDNAISNGGTGTQVNGDEATVNNNGNTTVDGQGSTGTEIAGNNAVVNQDGTFYNTGKMLLSNSSHSGVLNFWGGNGRFINGGIADVTAKSLAVSASDAGSSNAFFWNQSNGVVNFDKDSGVAVKFIHSNYVAQNDGTMNISGNNAIAMEGDKNARLVNNGTINLGTSGTTDTGMIGMQLDSGTTADAVIENNGAINIYANNSFAFSMLGSVGHLVNNGTVTIADGVTGSGLIKQGDSVNIEGVNGNNGNNSEVHYADYTLPDVPGSSVSVAASTPSSDGSQNKLNGYVVGTSSDGSAGKLKVNNASLKGVSVNTGFTAGTSSTSVTFDNVVQGSNLTDAETITSTSVVWNAQGTTDASGNVDVTMTKNAYTDVATDSSVNTVAQVLDAGYTNNELYSSLNVGTTAELNSALKQVSGSQATTVFNEARVLSNRFSMLSDAAPEVANGLAFNVVAKGDPRAELGNDTQYDMMALRKSLTLTEHQNLSLEYGIARLEGNGSDTAGDNGVTGGYSQFFGLKHQMAFDNGMNWNNALRYD
ncbi:TPA: beta strand repeat-containing protein, partial [Escherichia coli]